MATDGLWDQLTPREVETIIQSYQKDQTESLKNLIKECCRKCVSTHNIHNEKLLEHKNRRMYIDDISIVMFDLRNRP